MVDQQREREDKYDVGPGWQLPDLADLVPQGGGYETAELHLVNSYYDTPSTHLAQLGVTLRRPEGGPDAGAARASVEGGAVEGVLRCRAGRPRRLIMSSTTTRFGIQARNGTGA